MVCLVGFWLRNAPLVSYPKSDSFFKNGLTHLTLLDSSKRAEKSQAILALLDGFQELYLDW